MASPEVSQSSSYESVLSGLQGKSQQKTLWSKIRHKIQIITDTNFFNGFIMVIILLNAVFLALETDKNLKVSWFMVFQVMDDVFLVIYSIEFVLKVIAKPREYFTNAYDLFDFILLSISYIHVLITAATDLDSSKVQVLLIMRAFRTLRMLRTVQYSKGLQVLVVALLDTIKTWVIHIVFLLLLIMFFFAVMGYYLFGYPENGDKENFGDLGRSMLTVFSLVTGDGWTDLLNGLYDKGFSESALIYTVVFIILGNFILSNIFVGVIIMNISDATDEFNEMERERRQETIRKKREFMMARQHNDVQELRQLQKDGKYDSFAHMVKQFQSGLRHDETVKMSDVCTNLIWMETFSHTLDHMDSNMYRIQQLQFEIADHLASVLENRLQDQHNKKHTLQVG